MNAIRNPRLLATMAGLAVTAALYGAPTYAQSDSAPLSRAAVNAETRAANVARQLMPAGEGTPTDIALHSSKTRIERKAETIEARRKGEIQPGGLGLYKSNMSQQTAMGNSTKTRAERKAETQQAAKDHTLLHAGEAG